MPSPVSHDIGLLTLKAEIEHHIRNLRRLFCMSHFPNFATSATDYFVFTLFSRTRNENPVNLLMLAVKCRVLKWTNETQPEYSCETLGKVLVT